MDIVLCGGCGWLGSTAEVASKDKTPDNPAVKSIVLANGLTCKCCPKCWGTTLYTKPLAAPFQFPAIGPNEGSWLHAPHARGPQNPPDGIVGVAAEDGSPGVRISERPADIPAPVPAPEPEVSVASSIEKAEEELPDITGEDVELTADIVAEVLREAGKHGQKKEAVAKDLANGLSPRNKQLIAEVAEVPVEVLKDSPPKPKVELEPRDPVQRKKFKCDVCEKEFEAKVMSSRCPKCTKEYMELMVGS